MNKEFLTEPDRFVSTVNQRLTKAEFLSLQKGQFLLFHERKSMGIAVFRTNENLSGKLLFNWSDPMADGREDLIIEHAVVYGRVKDGTGPRRIGPFRIKPGYGLDLDTGQFDSRLGDASDEGIIVDIRHGIDPDSGELVIEANENAVLHFPVETMCSETSQ